jgi:hypothetical protein
MIALSGVREACSPTCHLWDQAQLLIALLDELLQLCFQLILYLLIRSLGVHNLQSSKPPHILL